MRQLYFLIVIFFIAITLSIYSIKTGFEGFDDMNTGCPAGTISLAGECVANTVSLALDTQVTANMTAYSLLVYYRLLQTTTNSAISAIKSTFKDDTPFLTDEQYAIFGGPPPIDLNTQITSDITLDYLIAYFKFLQATTKSVVTAINNNFKDGKDFLSDSDYTLFGGPPPITIDTPITANTTIHYVIAYFKFLQKVANDLATAAQVTLTDDDQFLNDDNYKLFGGRMIPAPTATEGFVVASKPLKAGAALQVQAPVPTGLPMRATPTVVPTAITAPMRVATASPLQAPTTTTPMRVATTGPTAAQLQASTAPMRVATAATTVATASVPIQAASPLQNASSSLQGSPIQASAGSPLQGSPIQASAGSPLQGSPIQASAGTPLQGSSIQASAGTPLQTGGLVGPSSNNGNGIISSPIAPPIPTKMVRATSDLTTFINANKQTAFMLNIPIDYYEKGDTNHTTLGDFITKYYPKGSNDPAVVMPSIIGSISKVLINIKLGISLVQIPIVPVRLIPDKTLCTGTLKSGSDMLEQTISYYKKGDTSTITLGDVNNNIPSLVTSIRPILNNINTALIYAPVPIIPVRLIPDKKLCVGTLQTWSQNFGTAITNIQKPIKNKTIINETTLGDFIKLGPSGHNDPNTVVPQMKNDISKGVTILKTALTLAQVPVVTNTVPDVIDNSDHLIASLAVKPWSPKQQAPTSSSLDQPTVTSWTSMEPQPLVTAESLKGAIEKSRKHVTPQPVSIHGTTTEHNLLSQDNILSKQYETIQPVKPFERGVVLPKNNAKVTAQSAPSVKQGVVLTNNKNIVASVKPVVPLTNNKNVVASVKQGKVLVKSN